MREHQPQTPEQLQGKLGKIDGALERVDSVSQILGERLAARRLEGLIGFDYLKAAAGLGEEIERVQQNIKTKTLPKLLEHKARVERELEVHQKAPQYLAQIRQAVAARTFPRNVLEEAERIYESLVGTTPSDVPVEPIVVTPPLA